MNNKFLIFKVFGDWGHFKIPYTTTSPLSFPIPPKTTVTGMLGAILGLGKNEYLKYFSKRNYKLGIIINNPVKKIRIGQNLINTKTEKTKYFGRMKADKSARTQLNIEYLKNPSYTFIIKSEYSDFYNDLKKKLSNGETVYTLYLGISECIANYDYVGEFKGNKIKNENPVYIDSVLPVNKINNKEIYNIVDDKLELNKVHLPVKFNENRELIKSNNFLIEKQGRPLQVMMTYYYEIENINKNVILY
ncbi:MAG: type I-B CRISPR-associated protein Cas5 [Candidatus Mcinerneyibacterium aminivorans]|uniref:Type I-B CRISPR-associated protein Cas5 n=1 Tax=Candidatus Mcinerneyibacterium aminivorans TaxID=2703815 RepID=A0A5D0MG26_9BACT|nr:MAG: type I-B CRISPR-associated protein Cas5 [Candidatus Mcinerneyibacterium aminivorans]